MNLGNGADRRLVVLRACACISHWNCLCGGARLFLDVLKTTSTIEQFAHGCKFLWIIAAQFGSAPHPLPDPLLQFWGVGHQVSSASFIGSFLGKPALQRFPIWINGLCSTDQRHMNVSIPPHSPYDQRNIVSVTWTLTSHPTPPHDQRNIMSVTWTLTSHPTPPQPRPPHDQRNIMSVTWTLTSHPTPPQPRPSSKKTKKQTKNTKKKQNTQAPCSAHGN